MFVKSLLAIALVCFGTASAAGGFNFALNSTAANKAMDYIVSSHTIDSTTRSIIEQAAFQPLKDWNNLKTVQESVKVTARTWRSTGRPALFKINDGIIAYNEQFVVFFDYLLDYATRLNSDTGALSDFVDIVNELKSEIVLRKDEADDTFSKLSTFRDSLTTHKTTIDDEYKNINSTYLGQNGKLNELRGRIADLEDEIKKFTEQVTTDPSGKVTYTEESANLTRAVKKKLQLLRQLAELELAVRETGKLCANVASLAADVSQTIDAINQVTAAWNQLYNDYGVVVATLGSQTQNGQDARREGYITERLKTAKQQWQELSQRAKGIKRSQLMNRANSQRNN